MRFAFQLHKETLAISVKSLSERARMSYIPAGSLVTADHDPPANSRQLVEVSWNCERWQLFAIDLIERAERIPTKPEAGSDQIESDEVYITNFGVPCAGPEPTVRML
jgi:hypothetical protein